MSKVSADNKAIKFPSHHYVGFQSRPSQDNCPLGFMTPDGNDAAAKKRKESVDKWATPYQYHGQPKKEKVPSVTYENKPMVGFKLSREVRRYASFGNGNVKWRIEDPRGFELEISSANFAQILMLCTMEKGEIQDQLIWGRLGSENVLVPVESEVYKTAQANTERAAKKASLKDLKLGDKVVMVNGDEGVFYGKFYLIYNSYSYSNIRQTLGDKQRWLFKSGGEWNSIATPKLAEIIPGDGNLTPEAAEQEINAACAKVIKNNSYGSAVHEAYPSYTGRVAAVTTEAPKKSDLIISSETRPFSEASKLKDGVFFGTMPGQGNRWCAFSMNQYHQTCAHNRNGFDKVWIHSWDKDKIEQEGVFESTQPARGNIFSYNQPRYEPERQPHTDMPDELTQYTIMFKTTHSGMISLVESDYD
jgi:hypothetical protein